MQDPAGFLRYPRQAAEKQHVKARVRHWHEYEQTMPDTQARCQARRCMDCGTPWCHDYCPVHNLIPDWNDLVTEADWYVAWQCLESTNNVPEFTGRICNAPCEAACTLSIGSHPVTIRCIELAIAEHAWQAGWVRPQPSIRRLPRQVAIIGSGPAGLACAQQLARAGYRVTVFEQADRAGGLLRYGIPDYRLDKRVLDRRLAQLQAEGVRFRTGVHVGVDLDIGVLRRSGYAVVLACGAQRPRDLTVPGRGLRGIHFALDYLHQQNRRVAGDVIDPDDVIDAAGKNVVVVGGGDTGGDCVGTAIRQGARQVLQLQYHDCPPARLDRLQFWPEPVPEWHLTDHDTEGCQHVWGYDTVAFEGRRETVQALALQRLSWVRCADGTLQRRYRPDAIRRLPAELVLLAMGYAGSGAAGIAGLHGPRLDGCGNIAASDEDYHTSIEGLFACGDSRRGQSLVVWAIREGRQCARAVDTWLAGHSDLPRD